MDKFIPKDLNDLNRAIALEMSWFKAGGGQRGPAYWLNPNNESFLTLPDFSDEKTFFQRVLPAINRKEKNLVEYTLEASQSFSGDWHMQITSIQLQEGIFKHIVNVPFSMPFGLAGCIAFLMMKGYKYEKRILLHRRSEADNVRSEQSPQRRSWVNGRRKND